MNFLILLAPVLSLLVLGAHFYRAGLWPIAAVCGALVLLLALPRAWVARLVQLVLLLGALEWLVAAWGFVSQRMAMDQPWTRLLVILVVVALLTALSAAVFQTRRLRARYRLG